MTFDPTQPTNTTLLRDLGVVIRPNWEAIESGDDSFLPQSINLANRTPLAVPNNPAALANTVKLFCKDDSAGNEQVYGIDSSSNIQQITRYLDFLSANTGYSYLLENILVRWGRHTTTATTTQTVIFPASPAFSAAPFIVIPMIQTNSSRVFVNMRSSVAASFVANSVDQNNNAVGAGQTMYWLAVGPA